MITSDWSDYLNIGTSSANIDISKHRSFKIQCILDILEGCKYHCPGCFVKKKHNYHDSALDNVLSLNIDHMDDLVLGPTDFFGADNILQILEDPRMIELCRSVEGIQHNTSIDGDVTDDFVKDVISYLESNEVYTNLNYDVQIAVDVYKTLHDPEYQSLIDERFDIFEKSSLKYEVSLLANIDKSIVGIDNIQKFVSQRWNTVLEYVPSIMRSSKPEKIKSALDAWKTYKTNYNIHTDNSHKSFNHIILNFNKDKIYLAPFIYENGAVYTEDYRVHTITLDAVYSKYQEMVEWQYENAGETCKGCDYLSQCVTHLIPFFTTTTLNERDYCPLNTDLL